MNTQLTEKQAWESIAMMFEDYAQSGQESFNVAYGLCHTVDEIRMEYLITDTTCAQMRRRIGEYMAEEGYDDMDYIWPADHEHAKDRAELARKFAAQCS